MGEDLVGRERHVVATRSGDVAHADHDLLARLLRLLDRIQDLVGGERGAARRVDAEQDRLDVVVFGRIAEGLSNRVAADRGVASEAAAF